jgi:hypothetical protein
MLSDINNFINDLMPNNNLNNMFMRLCDKFASDDFNNINSIKFVLADRFNYYPMEQDDITKKLCEEREKQQDFRQGLILRDRQCLITGDNYEICEACHIIPYSEKKSFDIANGLLLNRCFHKMFDNYLLSINPLNDNLEFSNRILDADYYHNYKNYNGKILKIHNETKEYLKSHYNIFLIKNEKNILDDINSF